MTEKRGWLQITLNVMSATACIFVVYNAIRYPREASRILLAVAGTMVLIGILSLAGTLICRVFTMFSVLICKMDDRRRGGPSEFCLADRMRLRLLTQSWLAKWLPDLWDLLREGLRRSRCCEVRDCWDEPTCRWEEHRVCLRHHADVAALAVLD